MVKDGFPPPASLTLRHCDLQEEFLPGSTRANCIGHHGGLTKKNSQKVVDDDVVKLIISPVHEFCTHLETHLWMQSRVS